MQLKPQSWYHLSSQQYYPLQPLPWLEQAAEQPIHALAGIGHPQRFFDTLVALDIEGEHHHYDDHYQFTADDFSAWQQDTVLMTEKDAVKCQAFSQPQWWALIVAIDLPKHLSLIHI